jgi:hypothetical protein
MFIDRFSQTNNLSQNRLIAVVVIATLHPKKMGKKSPTGF